MIAAATMPAVAHAAAFGMGNLVVYRVGSGASVMSNAATQVFLDEFTTNGALVQSIALPIAPGSAPQTYALTASGTASSEGNLARTADGASLLVPGYSATQGLASVASSSGATWPRVVGRIAADGSIDTSQALTDWASGNNPRGLVGSTASNVWVAGGAGGVRYTQGGASTSLQVSATLANVRVVRVFGGQLFVTTSSGTAIRLGGVGSGLPSTSGQTITNLPGLPTGTGSPYGFYFCDLNAGVAGLDTLYLCDDSLGLQKYTYTNASWTLSGTLGAGADAYRGITGVTDGTNVVLYATRKGGSAAAGGGELVQIVDTNGYGAGYGSASASVLATAAVNTAFRGVDFAPDSGAPSLPAVSFSATGTAAVAEAAAPLTVDVRLSTAATGSVQIASTGSAELGTDFTLSATNFDFTAGSSTQTLTITLNDDASIEAVETVALTLVNPAGATPGAITNFAFTLLDNDQPLVHFDVAASPDTTEGAGPLSLSLELSGSADVTVQVSTAGTALEGIDFTLSATQFVFTAGGPVQLPLTVTLVDDLLAEGVETGALSLVNVSGAAHIAPSVHAFAILDNEPAVRWTVAATNVSETGVSIDAVVYKTAPLNAVTGSIVVSGSATSPDDFALSTTNFVLDGATTSAVVTVSIADDLLIESDETVVLGLAGITAAATGTPAVLTISIGDNEVPPALAPGDAAVIGRINNGTPDGFSLLLLTNLVAGQRLYVTDNGWATNGFRGAASSGRGNEDLLRLTLASNLVAGTIIPTTATNDARWTWDAGTAVPGTNSTFGFPALSTSGDQLYLFTAPLQSPLQNPSVHVFVLDDTAGFEEGTTTTTGAEPPGLSSNTFTALSFNLASSGFVALDMANAATQSFTKSGWLAFIAEVTNWVSGASGSLPTGMLAVAAGGGGPVPTAIHGRVLVDSDGDGVIDSADETNGLAGVQIVLGGAASATQTTDSAGAFVFSNLLAGAYTLVETDPPGYLSTEDTDGGADGVIDVDLAEGPPDTNSWFLVRALSAFEMWAAQNGIGAGQEQADEDGDGFANLLEYVTGGNPTNADNTALLASGPISNGFRIVFYRATNATDASLYVDAADSVTNDVWSTVATNRFGVWNGPATVTESGTGSPVTVTAHDPVEGATTRVMRIRATRP